VVFGSELLGTAGALPWAEFSWAVTGEAGGRTLMSLFVIVNTIPALTSPLFGGRLKGATSSGGT
tara:strand:- start:370 stop:561 length:192 start_codon:yes stop_codon:yes gene_type:complete